MGIRTLIGQPESAAPVLLALTLALVGCGADRQSHAATLAGPAGVGVESTGGEWLVEAQALRSSIELDVHTQRHSATSTIGGARPHRYAANSVKLAKAQGRLIKTASGVAVSAGSPRQPPIMIDGRAGRLLIYEARVRMAVFKVEDRQRDVMALAKELGGHMSQRSNDMLVIRVPAQRFEEAMSRLDTMGDVLMRKITSGDVTEVFRDTRIRLANAERVRDRLADLLNKATNVEESLKIEAELDRLTERIERLKGKLRALEDRIALSRITVSFKTKQQENIEPGFKLPFDWLRELGLQTLLELQ